MSTNDNSKTEESRGRAIDAALSQIEKQFGKGAVMKMGQKDAGEKVPAIPTGSIAFDLALGIGGFPRGRVVEVFGPEVEMIAMEAVIMFAIGNEANRLRPS